MKNDIVNVQNMLIKYMKTGDKATYDKLYAIGSKLASTSPDYEMMSKTDVSIMKALSDNLKLEICLIALKNTELSLLKEGGKQQQVLNVLSQMRDIRTQVNKDISVTNKLLSKYKLGIIQPLKIVIE